jgi:hypothetical protein
MLLASLRAALKTANGFTGGVELPQLRLIQKEMREFGKPE